MYTVDGTVSEYVQFQLKSSMTGLSGLISVRPTGGISPGLNKLLFFLLHMSTKGYRCLSVLAVSGTTSTQCQCDCCKSYFLSQTETLAPSGLPAQPPHCNSEIVLFNVNLYFILTVSLHLIQDFFSLQKVFSIAEAQGRNHCRVCRITVAGWKAWE